MPIKPTPPLLTPSLPVAEPRTIFKCTCNASARFFPVYRFNQRGSRAQIIIGTDSPACVMCVNCKQLYVWSPPSKGGSGVDGGWQRQSALDDLLELEASGG